MCLFQIPFVVVKILYFSEKKKTAPIQVTTDMASYMNRTVPADASSNCDIK